MSLARGVPTTRRWLEQFVQTVTKKFITENMVNSSTSYFESGLKTVSAVLALSANDICSV
jgi:hypothetical protein